MLFGGVTYESLERRQYEKDHGQHFWWASIPLDTHHIDHGPGAAAPCKEAEENCVSWDPVVIERYPGWLTMLLMASAFPAFLVGIPLMRVLGRHGVSELWSFVALMPLLIFAWYYAIGWLIDCWRFKRLQRN